MKKTNYFYIDESGHINNDSNVFIYGCIKTDAPQILLESIKNMKNEIIDDFYFNEDIEKIEKQGLHAVDNHPDVRKQYYRLLPFLNFRAYFVVVSKKSEYFIKLKDENEDYQIFEMFIKKLILNRIQRNKNDRNIFYFENIEIKKKSLENILFSIFENLKLEYDCDFKIESKELINLSAIDYLNYIFFSILNNNKINERMEKNFNLIAPKIGSIHLIDKNVYLSRKKTIDKRITLINLKREYSG
jgi:hypothetical protein